MQLYHPRVRPHRQRMTTNGNEDLRGRIALITGVSRKEGLGFEVGRQLGKRNVTVILTARDVKKAQALAGALRDQKIEAEAHALDVTSDESVAALATALRNNPGRLDVLVNNAGGNYDFTKTVEVEPSYVRDTLEMNVLGAWRVTRALLPLLRQSAHGRIVNVSSEHGSFGGEQGMARHEDSVAAYGVSKAALNAFTLKMAVALRDTPILVNSACPGLTATFPGAVAMGARPVEQGAASIVWAATLPGDGPRGGFFRDGRRLPW
jgi:NAD(P)-dependent dehydrogenase (short-subunit alcohol dehydrogenase family)